MSNPEQDAEEVYTPGDFTHYIPHDVPEEKAEHFLTIDPQTVDTCKVYDAGWHIVRKKEE